MSEKIIKQGNANWYHGVGSKGGKLILTTKTIYFEGHSVNAGKKEMEIDLQDIKEIKTSLLNNLIIITSNGKETFAVNGKNDWKQEIMNAVREIND